jgi:hypothetical protein
MTNTTEIYRKKVAQPEAAEQFTAPSVWLRCCDHLKRTIAAIGPPAPLRLLTDHANRVG